MYLQKSVNGEDFEMKYILKSFFFGIGVRKDSPELLQWLNTFIYSLKNDGILNDLSLKYRNAPLPELPVF
jgi:polar amino acid transport system substrate-binding protein